MEVAIDNEPLFTSAHTAVRYAFNFRSTDFGKNALAAWIKDESRKSGSGKGLRGNDGAAQAGMVLAEVDRLGEGVRGQAMRAVITCRYGDRGAHCPSCGGSVLAQHWRDARDELTEFVLIGFNGISPRQMRRALVERFFGVQVKMGELAQRHDVDADTVTNHYKQIRALLEQLEESAMMELESALQAARIVSTTA